MNYYPGQGLTIGTAILGSTLGQEYPTGASFSYCKVYGKILTVEGDPIGAASSVLINDSDGKLVVSDGWEGVKVVAYISTLQESNDSIIATTKASTTTNEYGYFEFQVIQGLDVKIASTALIQTISVDTYGASSVNVGTLI